MDARLAAVLFVALAACGGASVTVLRGGSGTDLMVAVENLLPEFTGP